MNWFKRRKERKEKEYQNEIDAQKSMDDAVMQFRIQRERNREEE